MGVEVGEREHRLGASQVLRDPAEARLLEAPELLDDSERMLATGPRPGASPVDLAPALAQLLVAPRRTPVDSIANALRLERLPVAFLPVRLVAVELPLLAVEQVS